MTWPATWNLSDPLEGNMPMREFWTIACVCAIFAGPVAAAGPTKRPNVLFVIADDMNKHLPCFGHTEVKAPNVERLAAVATRFDRAYCQYPVCSPSRVSFLSGRRPEHTGMYGNDGASRTPLLKDAVFLPEHFKANGYFTARVGKVFHIGRDVAECWDVTEEGTPDNKLIFQPAEIEKLGLADRVKVSGKLMGGGGEGNNYAILDTKGDDLIDARIGTRAAELVARAAKGDKPFFLACGFRRPHLPRTGPSGYFDQYPLDGIALPAKSPVTHPNIKAAPSEADTREALRSYFACVSFMDEQLGKVFAALDEHKLWGDTVVIFIGDHGYSLGGRGGWWGKNTGYDDSCSTALLIHSPGQTKPAACGRVVEFLDFYPTLVELCGLRDPPGLEGRSLKPLLLDPQQKWDHPAFTIVASDNKPSTLAVSTARYRWIQKYDGSGNHELYDIVADPNEWKNLAGKKPLSDVAKHMAALADEYRSSVQSSGRK